jgi:2-keto-4-pentenoate hydratase/2-oxohepta-3-ene-1,7-dioic acid hydratase in catechol pathway
LDLADAVPDLPTDMRTFLWAGEVALEKAAQASGKTNKLADVRQSGNTGEMIFNIFEQISYLSAVMTLEPGDLLATGTPAGVGALAEPQKFLKLGEVVRIEIEKIGSIENRVIDEPV